jgi:hypothetical protein
MLPPGPARFLKNRSIKIPRLSIYLNVQLGLSYADFQKEVLAQTRDNVYKGLLKNEEVLKFQMSTEEQRTVPGSNNLENPSI